MKTKLIFVRHGETELNIKGKLHTNKDEHELTNEGVAQVKKTAKKLQNYNPSIIYSSKEKRAVETAKIIGKICNLPFKQVDGLENRDWGKLSGKTWSEIANKLDKMSLEERYNYVPPQGESWKTTFERIKKAFEKIIQNNKGKTIVIVTHAGTIRAIIPHLLDRPKEESFKYNPANASISIFDYLDSGFEKIIINDISHL